MGFKFILAVPSSANPSPEWAAGKKSAVWQQPLLVNESVAWRRRGNGGEATFTMWEEQPTRMCVALAFCGRGSLLHQIIPDCKAATT